MAFAHDRRYKRIFSNPYFLQKLLESFVRESFIRNLDFSTLKRVDKSFINSDFQEKESDLIFTIQFKKKTIYIFLLLEFQSTVDKMMTVRFLRYIMELYESFRKIPETGLFPAVFPVLLYSGDSLWTAKEEVSSLIDILMDIIKDEDLSVVKELAGWFNNYLSGVNESMDKESISQKLETIMEVKAMFATKLKEHDEKLIKQGMEKGMEKGVEKGIEQTALNMLKAGISVEIISKTTGLTEDEISLLSE